MEGETLEKRAVPIARYPAKWTVYGLEAGTIRNQEMLDKGKPDLVVCFPGGRGTQNMFDISENVVPRIMVSKVGTMERFE